VVARPKPPRPRPGRSAQVANIIDPSVFSIWVKRWLHRSSFAGSEVPQYAGLVRHFGTSGDSPSGGEPALFRVAPQPDDPWGNLGR
jgi:hypothetical protein